MWQRYVDVAYPIVDDSNLFQIKGCASDDDCDSRSSYCDADSCACVRAKCGADVPNGRLIRIGYGVGDRNELQCEPGKGQEASTFEAY